MDKNRLKALYAYKNDAENIQIEALKRGLKPADIINKLMQGKMFKKSLKQ